jgi:hypothetical protein
MDLAGHLAGVSSQRVTDNDEILMLIQALVSAILRIVVCGPRRV